MSYVKCRRCGCMFSSAYCPNCGMAKASQKKSSGLAVASMVLGLIAILSSCIWIGIIIGILSFVFGLVSLGTDSEGKAFAISGVILSICSFVLVLFLICTGNMLFSSSKSNSTLIDNTQAAQSDNTESDAKKSTEDDSKAKKEKTKKNKKKSDLHALNEECTLGDWTITATDTAIVNSISNGEYFSFAPDKGNKYLTIDLTITNNGSSTDVFLPYASLMDDTWVKVVYKDKYDYSESELLGYSHDMHNMYLNPLSTKSGRLAFEIPDSTAESSGKLVLYIYDGLEEIKIKIR